MKYDVVRYRGACGLDYLMNESVNNTSCQHFSMIFEVIQMRAKKFFNATAFTFLKIKS